MRDPMNPPRIARYCALPDAIPENVWHVVPCDAEYTPLRGLDDDWLIVATFADHDKAERHAANLTTALQYATF